MMDSNSSNHEDTVKQVMSTPSSLNLKVMPFIDDPSGHGYAGSHDSHGSDREPAG